MSFVVERISDEDKCRIDPKLRLDQFGQDLGLTRWIVDRENDIYVFWVSVGRSAEGQPDTLVLSWKGHSIRFWGEMDGVGNVRTGMKLLWKIRKFTVPDEIRRHREEIKIAIKEALTTYGWLGDSKGVESVSFEFQEGAQ